MTDDTSYTPPKIETFSDFVQWSKDVSNYLEYRKLVAPTSQKYAVPWEEWRSAVKIIMVNVQSASYPRSSVTLTEKEYVFCERYIYNCFTKITAWRYVFCDALI